MVTGKDMLVDKLFAYLYKRAGEGNRDFLTYRSLKEALNCAKSPSLLSAIGFAVDSGVLIVDYAYINGRSNKVFAVSDEAIKAALDDKEARNVAALPF